MNTIYPAMTAPAGGVDLSDDDLAALIANPDIAPPELDSADKPTRTAAKARLRYIARHRATYRNDASVLGCSGALLDWDEASREAVAAEFAALGCGVTIFPSPSHWSGSGYFKVRGVISYSRELTADEHRHLYRNWILPRCPSADQSMFVPCIGCYAPSVTAANRDKWWVYHHPGPVLDVDAILATLGPAPVRALVSEWDDRDPVHPATREYRLERFRAAVAGRHVRPAAQAKTRDMTSPNKQKSIRAIAFPGIEWGLGFGDILDHLVSLNDGWTREELEHGLAKVWGSSDTVVWEAALALEDFALGVVGVGGGLTLETHLETAPPPPPPPPMAGAYLPNDTGNAERLIAIFGSRLRYALGVGWLRWTGARWEPRPEGPVQEAITCAKLVHDEGVRIGGDQGARLAKWGLQCGNLGRVRACLDVAASFPSVAVDVGALDADPWLLNCPNGTLDLRVGTLREARPEDLITRVTAVPYEGEGGGCPRFLRFVHECMGGDLELVGYLLRFLGYALTGDVSEHALGLWHGKDGANGKSTLIELMSQVMGEYAGSCAPELLLQGPGGAHPTGLMDLRGRRLVTSNETPEGKRWNESLVKQITGGDEVKARAMRQDFVGFKPTWKLILATNSLPRVNEQGGAFWRRVHLLPWAVSFRGREDRELGRTLKAEGPAILALLVRACVDWATCGGLRPPSSVTMAVGEYRASQDTVGQWIEDVIEADPDACTPRPELYQQYRWWCQDAGIEYPLNRPALFRVLEERGFTVGVIRGVRVYRGCKIKNARGA